MENLDFFIEEIEKLKNENRYEEAIFKLEEAIANYENNYKLYEELADIYLFLGNIKKAEKAVDYSLSLFKNSAT
jgi:tetratricopeptide (TPR) repeat protein